MSSPEKPLPKESSAAFSTDVAVVDFGLVLLASVDDIVVMRQGMKVGTSMVDARDVNVGNRVHSD